METPIFDQLPYRIDPVVDRQKIVTGNYVGDQYSNTKFGTNPITKALVGT